MKKTIYISLGLIGLVSSIIGFFKWLPQWLGASVAWAGMSIDDMKRLDDLSSQASLWIVICFILFVIGLLFFIHGIRQKSR